MTYAPGKNVETCSKPRVCWQPAEIEVKHALVDDEGTIYKIVTLGYCLKHGIGDIEE